MPSPFPATPPARHALRRRIGTALRRATRLMLPLTLIAGCTMNSASISKDTFARQVGALLAGKDSVVVPASTLTDFAWDALCFEREDTLRLRFKDKTSEQVLSLPYEEFFVDEGYVANSLEDACVAPGDRILIKKKYPGYQGPIEFQKAGQGS